MDQSPSARAKMHQEFEERRRRRIAEKFQSPGPGSHETKGTMSSNRAATSAFLSGTPRYISSRAQTEPEVGPSTYRLQKTRHGVNYGVSDDSGETMQTVPFRARTMPGLQLELMGIDTPGPGAYNTEKRKDGSNGRLADTSGECASWAFKSRVPKGGKLMWVGVTQTPGPGNYQGQPMLRDGSNGTLADSTGERSSHAFLSRSKRSVTAEELTRQTPPHVSPASYRLDKMRSGGNWAMAANTELQIGKGSSAFMSDVRRDDWLRPGF